MSASRYQPLLNMWSVFCNSFESLELSLPWGGKGLRNVPNITEPSDRGKMPACIYLVVKIKFLPPSPMPPQLHEWSFRGKQETFEWWSWLTSSPQILLLCHFPICYPMLFHHYYCQATVIPQPFHHESLFLKAEILMGFFFTANEKSVCEEMGWGTESCMI